MRLVEKGLGGGMNCEVRLSYDYLCTGFGFKCAVGVVWKVVKVFVSGAMFSLCTT
jgi:hypothetical protein